MSKSEIKVQPLRGEFSAELVVPGDKSISHRAAIMAGISNGTCRVTNFLPSEDCLNTLHAMEALGVRVDREDPDGPAPTDLTIHGQRMRLKAPSEAIDCGNSGTGMRLLAGLLSAQPFKSRLEGDDSLSGRPMGRIMNPLSEMGAKISTMGVKEGCAPLEIEGTELTPITYKMPMASAQVKSAVLLAGLFTEGKTTVVQPTETRDHTERMFEQFRVRTICDGNEISVYGGQTAEACDVIVPGDISSAAFWLVAGAASSGSRILLKDVGLNPTRTAILGVLLRMGAKIKDVVNDNQGGEPFGNIVVEGGTLLGTELKKSEIPNLIDEIPVIAVAGALAQGKTVIRNAAELRVKETDRIKTVVDNLRAMGGEVEELDDGMIISGGRKLKGAVVDSYGDHRIAMAFAVAGLFAEGETVIQNTECIATSYPGFEDHLKVLSRSSQ